MTPELLIRPLFPSEWPLVYSTWLKSYREGNRAQKKRWHRDYFGEQHDLVEAVLKDPRTWLAGVEVLDGGPRSIIGWACGTTALPGYSVLHYVYIRGWYRRRGLMTRLLNDVGVTSPLVVSHETRLGDHVLDSFRQRGWDVELIDPRKLL